jgi:hypothetical protein
MNNHEVLILIIISIIVCCQILLFFLTYVKISEFKRIFHESDSYKTIVLFVPRKLIDRITVLDLFRHIDYYSIYKERQVLLSISLEGQLMFIWSGEIDGYLDQGWVVVEDFGCGENVSLIKTSSNNLIHRKINESINTYLLTNKGAVSDFNLVKDIVDRNCDAIDEEINTQLPIPLYLGLMGTMLGIVVGLFTMPSISDKTFENSIDMLIGGVKIAMISSFIGLLLTTINSGFFYKGAKSKVESMKNVFFTFIQTQLLPILSQNVTSSIYSLQQNLNKFNEKFETNIGNFNGLLGKILSSFNSQVDLMQELKKVDVAQLARLNISVLAELRNSTKEFEKFNLYLHQVNSFVDNAVKLNAQIGHQLERTVDIEKIVGTIASNVALNRNLIEVLQADLQEIDSRKKVVSDAVINVDDIIQKGLEELKEHTLAKLHAIRDITIKEEDLLEKLLKEDRGNLDELKKLGSVKISMEKLESATYSQNAKLDSLINSVKDLSSNIKNQKVPDVKLPKSLKILTYIFFGTGTLIGLTYLVVKSIELIHIVIDYIF